MVTTVGAGSFVFEVVESWAKLPEGWSLKEVAGVGVDSRDRVYAFNRGEHPMIVFDREGNFLSSWGEGLFPRAHGVTMGPDDTIYCTDDGDHTVRKCTLDGRVRGYVNRCVNDIRRRPSQPLSQRRSHLRIERRDRRLRSTQGPSDA